MKVLLLLSLLVSCRAKTPVLLEREGEKIEELKTVVAIQGENIKQLKEEVNLACPQLLDKTQQLENVNNYFGGKLDELLLENRQLRAVYSRDLEQLRTYRKSYYVLVGLVLVVVMLGVKRIVF